MVDCLRMNTHTQFTVGSYTSTVGFGLFLDYVIARSGCMASVARGARMQTEMAAGARAARPTAKGRARSCD